MPKPARKATRDAVGEFAPNARQATALMKKLSVMYPGHPLDVNNDPEPFKVVVATMLSSRTKDPTTNAAMGRLLARATTMQGVLEIPEAELAGLVKPVGFYKQKAKHLHGMCRMLLDDFGGVVPRTRDELLQLPGVGRKVANLVLNVCFNIPAICVDTHVHRICNRFGWIVTDTPEQTEHTLETFLADKHWATLNRVLVNHGQQICHPTSPKCSECNITTSCQRVGVTRNR